MDLNSYFGSVKVYRDTSVIFEKEDLPLFDMGNVLEHFFYTAATKIELLLPDGTTRTLKLK